MVRAKEWAIEKAREKVLAGIGVMRVVVGTLYRLLEDTETGGRDPSNECEY